MVPTQNKITLKTIVRILHIKIWILPDENWSERSLKENFKRLGLALTYITIIIGTSITAIETRLFWNNMPHLIKVLNIMVLITGVAMLLLLSRKFSYSVIYVIFACSLMGNIYISGLVNGKASIGSSFDSNPYPLICFILIFVAFFGSKEKALFLAGFQIIFIVIQHCLLDSNLYGTILNISALSLFAVSMFIVFIMLEKAFIKYDQTKQIIINQKNDIKVQAQKLREQNNLLEKLQTYKEDMTHMIVHDIKNGLNIIINNSEETHSPLSMKKVHSSAGHLLNLTMNLLDIKKMEEARLVLYKEKLLVTEVIRDAMDQTDTLASLRNISIKQEVSAEFYIYADRAILKRVFINLLDNAIKYSPANETVFITAQAENNNVKISIADNGEGIRQSRLPDLFEKYAGTKNDRNNMAATSTGLGLAFCKLAVEAHDGQIWIEPPAARGTIVSVALPLIHISEVSHNNALHDKPGWHLSRQEKETIALYGSSLTGVECYNATRILDILKAIPSGNNFNIEIWKNEINNCIFTLNTKRYVELLQLADIYDKLQPTGNINC